MSQHLDAFFDDGPPISQLQAAVKALEAYVHAVVPPERPTTVSEAATATATATATSTSASTANQRQRHGHGHSALSPVQLFGRQEVVAAKWKELARAHVAVCGLGGVGARAADALVRAGVGRVLLVDHDRVRWSCLGRGAGFGPEDVGFSRAQALRLKLQSVRADGNAGLTVESFAVDWRSDADLAELRKKLKVSSVGAPPARRPPTVVDDGEEEEEEEDEDHADDGTGDNNSGRVPRRKRSNTGGGGGGLGLFEALTQRRPYDAVLSCLEDDADALALNEICLELSLPLLHASLSPCNSKIAIRSVLPGHTCCLACTTECSFPPHQQQQQQQHGTSDAMEQVTKSIARAFPASLPHVELMAGGLLGQHVIKFLLETGDFVPCFTVNAFTFEMESYSFPPNTTCTNAACRQRQEEEQEHTR